MRAIALCAALCAAAALAVVSGTRSAEAAQAAPSNTQLVEAIGRYQQQTWHWQELMGVPKTRSTFSARRSPDEAYRRWVLALWRTRAERLERTAGRWMTAKMRVYRAEIDHWRHVMGTAPVRQVAAAGGLETAFLGQRRAWRAVLAQAAHPPYESAWRCIHGYEGSWTDGGGPYYGGLQMDLGFQAHYGGYLLRTKGTADHWTPTEQMWVAARAFRSGRGFSPWPNTARACGLI